MQNTYVISWKSKAEAQSGYSKKHFSREEAERLAKELNEKYPKFVHEVLNTHPTETAAPRS